MSLVFFFFFCFFPPGIRIRCGFFLELLMFLYGLTRPSRYFNLRYTITKLVNIGQNWICVIALGEHIFHQMEFLLVLIPALGSSSIDPVVISPSGSGNLLAAVSLIVFGFFLFFSLFFFGKALALFMPVWYVIITYEVGRHPKAQTNQYTHKVAIRVD